MTPRRAPAGTRHLRALPSPHEALPPPDGLPPIPDVIAAYAIALGLHDEFGRSEAAFLLGRDGAVEQGWVLTADHHRPDDALMLCLLADDALVAGRWVLLVSTGHHVPTAAPAAADIAAHARFLWVASWRDASVIDWIHTDGELFRSMRLSLDPDDPWPSLGPTAAA